MLQFALDGAVVLQVQSPQPRSGDLLRRVAGLVLDVHPDRLSVRRSCPHCGSADHGRPFVANQSVESTPCGLSFSRTGGHAVAAARLNSRIGVDIESMTALSTHPVDDALLHPVEREALKRLSADSARRYRTQLWVAKEAVTKLTGDGLRVDLRQLHVECADGKGFVTSWPQSLDIQRGPRLSFFDVSDDVIGALAVGE